jgi:Protein of unknown function, DUF488
MVSRAFPVVCARNVETAAGFWELLGFEGHSQLPAEGEAGYVGTRSADAFVSVIRDVGVCTLVDVRRFPGSRHNPQFNEPALRAVLEERDCLPACDRARRPPGW